MNPLLAEPSDAQAALLDVVYGGRELIGGPAFHPASHASVRRQGQPNAWPIFQYVQAVLCREHGLDARALLAQSPSVTLRAGLSRYGWLHIPKQHPASLQPDDRVCLTVAGMVHLRRAAVEVEAFIRTLALLVQRERELTPSPTEVQSAQITSRELAECLAKRWIIGDAELAGLREMLEREPSTWHVTFAPCDDPDSWTATLPPFLRPYAGVANGSEYVKRLVDTIASSSPPPAWLHPSSLSLPEAIDYLNAVWRATLGARQPLFCIARAAAAAKLPLDCAGVDELEARLSAFCGILDRLQIPGCSDNKNKLGDLKEYLSERLPSQSARAAEAIDDLRAFVDLRVWRQHTGSKPDSRGSEAARRLGVDLTTGDWQGAWRCLQARAVAALGALREEIERLEDRPTAS